MLVNLKGEGIIGWIVVAVVFFVWKLYVSFDFLFCSRLFVLICCNKIFGNHFLLRLKNNGLLINVFRFTFW